MAPGQPREWRQYRRLPESRGRDAGSGLSKPLQRCKTEPGKEQSFPRFFFAGMVIARLRGFADAVGFG